MENIPWCLFISYFLKLFNSLRKREDVSGPILTKKASFKRLRIGPIETLHIEVNEYTPIDKD